MNLKCSAFIAVMTVCCVLVQGSREEFTGYELPEDWHGGVDPNELKKIMDKNTTIPGLGSKEMNKIRAVMDYVQTLPEDWGTVDRYNTPEFPTLGTGKIEREKIAAITEYVETSGYDTHHMVNHLIGKGYLKSKRIVVAMREVDKSEFAPMDPLKKGHFDYPIDIGYGTWMEPPYQIAGSLEYMNRWLVPGKKVLEIGAGTGYMTALLALLGGHVVSVEHVPELAKKIKNNIMNGAPRTYFRNNYEIICADGQKGLKEKGPYDLIYVSASFKDVPTHFFEQVNPGGLMVYTKQYPDGITQKLNLVYKLENSTLVACQLKFGGRMIFTHERPGTGKHALCVYHRFRNETDEVDLIHSSVFLPPLTNLSSQLNANSPFRYNASMNLRSERWFTGDYYGCYFDRSQKETRNFESEYDNPTEYIPIPGQRSSPWWYNEDDAPVLDP